jgi:aspartyl-tRNA(Asn)/glutamyl-tRNA(Gln) amidotransferase subunit B
MSKYEVVIGIETHVQLATKSKLFCGCNNDSREAEPNTHVCPVCLGLPGALPVLNGGAVKLALKAGHTLNAYEKPKEFHSKFDRKNYFYPDSPMNYQITQFDEPIVGKGYVEFPLEGEMKRVGVTRAHLEADAGKLIHPAGKDYSLVDLNRAGTPLLEIVSEPDIRSAAEAKAYAQELYNLMRYANVSDANLYYGNMRFDVNVSLRPAGAKEFGTRTETKNLNSFRAVAGVVEYEMKRQAKVLESGKNVAQETRGWNEDKGETFSQRSKEEAHDYRYFPEPDLPPLVITTELLAKAKLELGTSPAEYRAMFHQQNVEPAIVEVLIAQGGAWWLQGVIEKAPQYTRRVSNWLASEIPMLMAASRLKVAPGGNQLIELAEMVEKNEISSTGVKGVLAAIMEAQSHEGERYYSPRELAQRLNLVQNSDADALEKIVDQVIADNPGPVEQYKAGEQKVIGFLVGQVMKQSRGQANPPMVNDILKKKLGS